MTEEEITHKAYTNGRVFIVRPFNIKTNRKDETIDFDKVDNELISPCIEALGLSGGTTGEFVQQGNIREDMFRELLAADLVIADISIHNANVFYELGIRHALRDRCTILIKADQHTDPGIFDLSTDRYMSYDLDNPSNSIDKLTDVVTSTLQSEGKDSPVFKLLPGLTNMDPDKVVIVPLKFREEVDQFTHDKNKDGLTSLRDNLVIGQPWERQGLRMIGNAQYELADFDQAIKTWEAIRNHNMFDTQANQRLATCYQKVGELVKSEHAAERALEGESDWDRAKTHALIGSNLKTRWILSWKEITDLNERQKSALKSPLLQQAYESYYSGFEQHRSHYYSGLNAVAMLSIQLELAKLQPETWTLDYASEAKSNLELEEKTLVLNKMINATELAIETSINNYNDTWAKISKADLMLLTCNNAEKVKHEYSKYLNVVPDFNKESLRRQIGLYKDLRLFDENIAGLDQII